MSASATLLAAPRRRAECLSAMPVLQTRAARRAGQSQLGPALCLRHRARVDHASRFLKLCRSLKPRRADVLTIVALSSRKHSGAANFWRMSADCRTALASRVSNPDVSASIRRRMSEQKQRPTDFATRTTSPMFCSRPQRDAHPHAADPLQDAAHRATSRRRRAIASRGSRTRRQPPRKKIEPGQP